MVDILKHTEYSTICLKCNQKAGLYSMICSKCLTDPNAFFKHCSFACRTCVKVFAVLPDQIIQTDFFTCTHCFRVYPAFEVEKAIQCCSDHIEFERLNDELDNLEYELSEIKDILSSYEKAQIKKPELIEKIELLKKRIKELEK